MTNIFVVEHTNDEGRTYTYPSVFTDESSAQSLVDALNVSPPELDLWNGEKSWAVVPLDLNANYGEVYVPEFHVQVTSSILNTEYVKTEVRLNKAVLAGTPATPDTVNPPSDNSQWWNAHLYGFTIEAVEYKADLIAAGLNSKYPVSHEVLVLGQK